MFHHFACEKNQLLLVVLLGVPLRHRVLLVLLVHQDVSLLLLVFLALLAIQDVLLLPLRIALIALLVLLFAPLRPLVRIAVNIFLTIQTMLLLHHQHQAAAATQQHSLIPTIMIIMRKELKVAFATIKSSLHCQVSFYSVEMFRFAFTLAKG